MKQHFDKNFYLLVQNINKAYVRGYTTLFFKTQSNLKMLLLLLLKEGYIMSYQVYKSFIFIRLNTASDKRSVFEKSKRVGRAATSSLRSLKHTQYVSGTSVFSVLSTDKGLLTSLTAVEKGVGGRMIFKAQ